MRVALLQLMLDARSRASNLQGVMRSIDEASKSTPAPDLLVLPGACDTGGSGPGRGFSEVTRQTVLEAIAFKAREWGVLIAVGLHRRCGDVWEPSTVFHKFRDYLSRGLKPAAQGRRIVVLFTKRGTSAVLFDPNGDLVAFSGASVASREGDDRPAEATWPSLLGTVGVLEPSCGLSDLAEMAARDRVALLAVPVTSTGSAKKKRVQRDMVAAISNSVTAGDRPCCCVAVPARTSDDGREQDALVSFVRDSSGRLLCSADDGREAILCATLDLDACAPGESAGLSGLGGR